MSKLRAQNLERIKSWEKDYNDGDAAFFVHQNYHPDCQVWFPGASAHGLGQFTRVEVGVTDGCAGRYMRVDQIHWINDERAVVEASVLDKDHPDFTTPFCALLSFQGGKIILDRTYLDTRTWPGIELAGAQATPGGLGTEADPARAL